MVNGKPSVTGKQKEIWQDLQSDNLLLCKEEIVKLVNVLHRQRRLSVEETIDRIQYFIELKVIAFICIQESEFIGNPFFLEPGACKAQACFPQHLLKYSKILDIADIMSIIGYCVVESIKRQGSQKGLSIATPFRAWIAENINSI